MANKDLMTQGTQEGAIGKGKPSAKDAVQKATSNAVGNKASKYVGNKAGQAIGNAAGKVAGKATDALAKTPQGQIAKQAYEKGQQLKDDLDKLKNKSSPFSSKDALNDDKSSVKKGEGKNKGLLNKEDDSEKNKDEESTNKSSDKSGDNDGLGSKPEDTKLFGKAKKNDFMSKTKRLVRNVQVAHTVGKFTMLYMMLKQMLMMFMMMIKQLLGFISAIIAKITAFIQGIINTVSSVIQGVLGVAAKVANAVATGLFVAAFGGVIAFATTTFSGHAEKEAARNDGGVVCDVSTSNTASQPKATAAQPIGEYAQIQREYAEKVYSFMKKLGYSDNFIAGVLGNWQTESGIDPTSVETIYTEPYRIGERKQHAIKVKFDVWKIDSAYAAKYTAIHTVGRGLGQWTNGRGDDLITYAQKNQKNWYDLDLQLAYMFTADDPMRVNQMKSYRDKKYSVEEATLTYLIEWEGNQGDKVAERTGFAKYWLSQFSSFKAQDEFADQVINLMDTGIADLNHAIALSKSRNEKDSKCRTKDDEILDEQLEDYTGVWPDDVQGWAWTPASLPASLKKFTHDPEKYGLQYDGSKGWLEKSGQCVDFSNSYYSVLYPNQAGITFGNGRFTAQRWAERFGEELSDIPHAGSVFSCENAYSDGAGHTGIVEHVFANGDILIIEQNTAPYSGDAAGKPNTWNWRKITKEEYQGKMIDVKRTWNWKFFKPSSVVSKWGKTKVKKIGSSASKYGVKNANELVKEAFNHIGKPYVWGAKGPATFDCSGLTRWVYLQVTGKDIGMNTTAQERCGDIIPLSEAKQGDLYFWGPHGGTTHVALAIGEGKYIEAPQPGETVHVSNVNYYKPDFALRPKV